MTALLGTAFASNSTTVCAKGLKMFVTRGTTEAMGQGSLGAVTKGIAAQINGSIATPILYPATEGNPVYFESVANGTLLLRNALTDYVQKCPDSKIAVLGYSQGAQVTTNALCGMPTMWGLNGLLGNVTTAQALQAYQTSNALPQSVHEKIVSVVLFGDPSRSNSTSFSNYGTWNQSGNGLFYRNDWTACETLGNRIRSYCDATDIMCDIGPLASVAVHEGYLKAYGQEVVKLVVQQYANFSNSGSQSDNASNSSSIDTPSSSATSAHDGAMGLLSVIGLTVIAIFMMGIAI
ncbi:hypothetical protein N7456_000187 [Penicillium angulare]|uniref:Cutinase n=1 Tax=Penicillium angulare TaxID=116970 RepID=A0A9W9GBN6_9EURO|nr:hypothetical protein N7456_000187 [Penicillium angulare]